MQHTRPSIPATLERILRRYATALIAIAFWSCATSVPPDGGPPDTEPPAIIETVPAHGSTNVTHNTVRIVFSEYVERNSFQQSVHISPLLSVAPKFEWSGKEVTLILPEDLREDKTYVISIGASVKDINAGNPMNSSFTLAFSTGDTLDAGMIRGQVFDADPTGITAFAYHLDGIDPDTLNPATLRPDYALQTDVEGTFILSNLASGTYRVFVVRDKQSDNVYTVGADAIGVAESDILTGSDSAMAPLRYRLRVADTTAPYIQSVRTLTARTLELRISEPPFAEAIPAVQISLRDSAASTALPVVDVIPVPQKNSSFTLFIAEEMGERQYSVSIDSLRDAAVNFAAPEAALFYFSGVTVADTARPNVGQIYPAPRASDALPDSVLMIRFSRPMTASSGVVLKDSAGMEVPLTAAWNTPHELLLQHQTLAYGMQYTLCIDLAVFIDSLNGRSVADSTFCYAFTTIASEIDGSISGNVTLERPAAAPVRVTARATTTAWTRTTTAERGRFAFPKVPEGKYILEGFVDSDTSGTYSFGKAHPFTPAERFGIGKDTVRVRARWETEGAGLAIP